MSILDKTITDLAELDEYLLTVDEVADLLRMSSRRAYDLVRTEGLRVKISEQRVRVPRPKLKTWLEEKMEGGGEEPEQVAAR